MTSNYVQETVDALTRRVGKSDGSDADLMRLYALLVHTTGTATSLKDVHDAWALWRTHTKPEHADLVEFEQLPADVQDYDRPYRDAIRELAAARNGGERQ